MNSKAIFVIGAVLAVYLEAVLANSGLGLSSEKAYSWCSEDKDGTAKSLCVTKCKDIKCYSPTNHPAGTYNIDCERCFCPCQWSGKSGYCNIDAIDPTSGNGATQPCLLNNNFDGKFATFGSWGAARCSWFPVKDGYDSSCAGYWNGKY